MTFKEAIEECKVRGYIYRDLMPGVKYLKNHEIPLKERVPFIMQQCTDWKTGDPESDDNPLIG